MKQKHVVRRALFKPASFAAAAVLCWMPLQAIGASYVTPPPGEARFWVGAYGVDPQDHLTYRVHYVDANGAQRQSAQEALGTGTPLFKLAGYANDLRIEAVRHTRFSPTETTVEYRCSKLPTMRVTISFSRNRSNSGC